MKWRVGHKLAAGFAAVIALLAFLAAADSYGDTLVRAAVERLYERGVVGGQLLGRAAKDLQTIRTRAFHHAAATEARELERLESQMEKLDSSFLDTLQVYEATLGGDTPERRQLLKELRERFGRYAELRASRLYPTSRAADATASLTILTEVIEPQFDGTMQTLDRLNDLHVEGSRGVNDDANATLRETGRLSLLLSILAAAIATSVAWAVSRSISERLREVAEVARQVSQGSLDARVDVRGSDEIASVALAFNELTSTLANKLRAEQLAAQQQAEESQRLADTVARYGVFISRVARGELTAHLEDVGDGDMRELGSNLQSMGEALRTMTLRIHEAVGALSSASAEIMTTVQEHATSANESASAVAETAATVDEVQQSAQRATEQAEHVADVSRRSAQVSDAGRQAVEHTVTTMNDVRQQVDGIAERILSLSEQTQAVGQIITSVNELAERSNLLALNAAIEAARAGEAGRGFAVVAQEIRALADQSREATSHVRAILGDIQKSTTEAVLATEDGSKAVARALSAVQGAGERIEQLAGSSQEASRAADHILTAAQQQAEGVGQISQAMHSIDAASRQTVEGTRNIESAARDLNQLAADLRDTVAQYRA